MNAIQHLQMRCTSSDVYCATWNCTFCNYIHFKI